MLIYTTKAEVSQNNTYRQRTQSFSILFQFFWNAGCDPLKLIFQFSKRLQLAV